ncbi:substrate-binding domain-containing protein [Saccharothrix lopnurensis]|uniref:Substrate-binding domain-containing protein n=1 Tax=Saccharothrix lopnurensis TaxID=1670621 RepID=A0ABW1PCI3_9PSEU
MSTSPQSWSSGAQRVPDQRVGTPGEPVLAGLGTSSAAGDARSGGGGAAERHPHRTAPDRLPTRPSLLELVFDHIHSEWAMEIIRGVEQVLSAEQAALVLSELGGDHRPRDDWFDDLLDRRPLGVVLVVVELGDGQRRRLTAAGIPFVFVDPAEEQPPGVPVVGSANRVGGEAATRHLVELGHRRIAVISGPMRLPCSRARVEGFRGALAAGGLSAAPDHVRYGEFRATSGYRHGLELLGRPDRPTAVFAGSDYQALGVMRAAHELGLSVPDDLSVVGYDDLSINEWSGPPLTTVRQPLRDMGAVAARMAITLARGQRPPHERIDLATELVVRQSTAPPRHP